MIRRHRQRSGAQEKHKREGGAGTGAGQGGRGERGGEGEEREDKRPASTETNLFWGEETGREDEEDSHSERGHAY